MTTIGGGANAETTFVGGRRNNSKDGCTARGSRNHNNPVGFFFKSSNNSKNRYQLYKNQ